MVRGWRKGRMRMKRLKMSLLALVLLSGCDTLNDAVVRQLFRDPGLSRKVNYQIREGLEKRKAAPQPNVPLRPAPDFLDQG